MHIQLKILFFFSSMPLLRQYLWPVHTKGNNYNDKVLIILQYVTLNIFFFEKLRKYANIYFIFFYGTYSQQCTKSWSYEF